MSLVALGAWSLAAGRTLGLWPRGARNAAWPPERQGLAALALVAVVFGVHSALDWTWFVPAVAVTGIFCAGWVAGRGPLLAPREPGTAGAPPLAAVEPAVPRGRRLRTALLPGVAVLAFALLTAVAVSEPWRSERKGNDALSQAERGDFQSALAATERAEDLNPLSVDPFFDRAAVQTAAGNTLAARQSLERAVQLQPASAEAWQRLGEYHLNDLSQPARAVPVLRAAVYLDPFNQLSRDLYVVALRAQAFEQTQRRPRPSSVSRKNGTPPPPARSTSP
jgi:tetratricopeptide (TPR) repeat protein